MSRVLSLRPSYYEALKRLTLELVGVNLGSDHPFLIETRLATLARREGFKDLNTLIDELFSRGQSRLAIKVVSALLERDTHFNPDPVSIQYLETRILAQLSQTFSGQALRLLSFGCSSGQEPISLAIAAAKWRQKHPEVRIDVFGVDYPSPALDRAKRGQYTHFEVQRGLPIRDLVTFFDRRGEDWIVKHELLSTITYREHHLLSNLTDLGQFHVVVFRNGLAHYASAAQIRVMRGLSSIVQDGGFLMLGAENETRQLSYGFEKELDLSGVYKKPIRVPDADPELSSTPEAQLIFDQKMRAIEKS